MILFLSFYTCHSHSRASVFSTLMPVFSTALSILSIVCTPLVLFSYVLCIINYSLKKYRRYIFTNCLISVTCFCAVSKPWGNMKLRYMLAVRRISMKGTSCSSQQLLWQSTENLPRLFTENSFNTFYVCAHHCSNCSSDFSIRLVFCSFFNENWICFTPGLFWCNQHAVACSKGPVMVGNMWSEPSGIWVVHEVCICMCFCKWVESQLSEVKEIIDWLGVCKVPVLNDLMDRVMRYLP